MATSMFHVHEFFVYSFTIISAIIADSWWGHFKTVVFIGFLYTAGSTFVAVGNIDPLNLSIL